MLRPCIVAAGLAVGTLVLGAPAHAAPPQFTPLTARVLAPPEPVLGTDGRRHLVYEILLQNDAGVRADVESLAVRTRRGRTLARFADAQVPTVMTTYSNRPASALEADAGGKVWLDVGLPRGGPLPRALVHRLSVRATLPGGQPRTFAFDAAATLVRRRPAASLRPPLKAGPYLNFNGCCGPSPHRTALATVDGVPWLSERFAADFIRIDARGRGGAGDFSRNESFFGFGEPVYAVAAGRVVAARDDLAENPPLMEPPGSQFTPQTTIGNSVVLRLAGGRFALYAHLRRGSVRVRRGERVRAGQVLAQVGNTGQSGGPHLHFQLSDGPDPLASDGAPFALARFTLLGGVTNVEQFLTGAANADIRRLAAPSPRRDQMPLHATVVRFPR